MRRWLLLYRTYQQPRKASSGTPDGRNTRLYIESKTGNPRLLWRNANTTRRLCSRTPSQRLEPQEKRSVDERGLGATLEVVERKEESFGRCIVSVSNDSGWKTRRFFISSWAVRCIILSLSKDHDAPVEGSNHDFQNSKPVHKELKCTGRDESKNNTSQVLLIRINPMFHNRIHDNALKGNEAVEKHSRSDFSLALPLLFNS